MSSAVKGAGNSRFGTATLRTSLGPALDPKGEDPSPGASRGGVAILSDAPCMAARIATECPASMGSEVMSASCTT
jgi:hypothetical protein